MPDSRLLGTPVRTHSRDERSTGAAPFRSTSAREPPPPNPFSTGKGALRCLCSLYVAVRSLRGCCGQGSPLQQGGNPPPSPSAAFETQSQTEARSSPRSSSSFRPPQPQQQQHSSSAILRHKERTEDELKAQARQAVLRTRIIADPSCSSAFKKEDDPGLYALFVG
ncbi:hypothetical protein JCM11641_003423 [Rhodosporidiobolus odoratus]